jgi:hypothetical protein
MNFDHFTKRTLALISILYGIGLIITNFHLSQLGLFDFELLRIRYIQVGITFLVFSLWPWTCIVVPILVFHYFPIRVFIIRIAFAALGALLLIRGSFPLFGWFLESTRYEYNADVWRFWKLYLHKLLFLPIAVFVCIPATLWLLHVLKIINLRTTPVSRIFTPKLLPIIFCFGMVAIMAPYVYGVYPNIVYGMGGGQPKIARIYYTKEASAALSYPNSGLHGAILLWHATDEFIYVQNYRNKVFAIKLSSIHFIEYVKGYVYFPSIGGCPRAVFKEKSPAEDSASQAKFSNSGQSNTCSVD